MQYQTIAGKQIELDSLSPFEQDLLRGQLDRIGTTKILYLNLDRIDEEITKDEKEKLPDTTLFVDTWNMLLRNRVSEADRVRIQSGPLATVIHDLTLRIGIVKHGWKKDFIQHDPRWFLRELRSLGSLNEFASNLELDQGQASKALAALRHDAEHEEDERCKQVHLAIPTLRMAASKLGVSFDYIKQDLPHVPRPVSCRDYNQQALGARISFIANMLRGAGFSQDDIEIALYFEFKARVGEPAEAIRPLLSLIANYPLPSIGCYPKEKVCAFEVTEVSSFKDFVTKYAWMVFAVEFHWFEHHQWIPLLLDSCSAKFWRDKGLEIRNVGEILVPHVEQNQLGRRGIVVHYEYIDGLLWRGWQVGDSAAVNALDLSELAKVFAERAKALLDLDVTRYEMLPLLGRWFFALTDQTYSVQELVKEFES